MIVIIKLVAYYLQSLVRHAYWLLNLNRIKGIQSTSIHFPIIVEGKGQISVGSDSFFGKRASFKIGGQLHFEENCQFHNNIDIRIGKGSSLIGMNNCTIGSNSKLYVNNHWRFGTNANIATNCAIFSREQGLFGNLIMGDNSYIADNCIIDVADNITIGNDVAIGPNCIFYTHDHDYKDLNLPAWNGKKTTGKITIGNKSWIGSNVTVLPGVTIGVHAVIAAGSVITKDIPHNTVWAGVPAKQIKSLIS